MPGLPSSQYFDLSQPFHELFRGKPLHESHHVLQGFAFDIVNARLFAAQLRNRSSDDDLCINQLDLSGQVLGAMHLNGAGHGVSIGVEPEGTTSYVWTECDADAEARGTALCRFAFRDAAPPVPRKLLRGSKIISCASDPVNARLAVRRVEAGRMWYTVHDFSRATAGDFTAPLVHFPEPALSAEPVTFQGYTIFGRYLYTLDGIGHAHGSDIDSYVTRIDMNTGSVESRSLVRTAASLIFREPEGMAVYRTRDGDIRLFIGFGSRDTLDGPKRYANLYYNDSLRSA
jgi:hypothetical protein